MPLCASLLLQNLLSSHIFLGSNYYSTKAVTQTRKTVIQLFLHVYCEKMYVLDRTIVQSPCHSKTSRGNTATQICQRQLTKMKYRMNTSGASSTSKHFQTYTTQHAILHIRQTKNIQRTDLYLKIYAMFGCPV